LNVVGKDGKIGKLHCGMLGQLFRVEGNCTPLENYAFTANHNAQIPHATTESTTQLSFQRNGGMGP
jgi:hypothetical protein